MTIVTDFREACARWAKPLTALNLILAIATLCGKYHPWFDLICQLQFQLLMLCIGTTVFWLLGKPRPQRWTLLALPPLLFHCYFITPWFQPIELPPVENALIRVATINVYTSNQNSQAVLELIAREQPEILVLVETDRRWLNSLSPLEMYYPHRISHPRDDNFGLAIYSRIPFINAHIRQFTSADIPSLVCSFHMNGRVVTVVATHPLPPVNIDYQVLRDQQLQSLAQFIHDRQGPLIVAGDLNLTMFSPVYRSFVETSGLQNTRKGQGVLGTWPTSGTRIMRLPLDHILHTADFATINCRVGPSVGSDHFPFIADLAFLANPLDFTIPDQPDSPTEGAPQNP